MPLLDYPQLRPFLAAAQDRNDPRYIFIWDRLGLGKGILRVTVQEFTWIRMFDGRSSLQEVQAEAMRQTGGQVVSLERFSRLATMLDQALFLDGPRFQELVNGPVREPTCIGCYEGEPEALRKQLTGLFTGPGGPGLPQEQRPDRKLRAALIPHIDYQRGGVTYTWGFKEVFERSDASLFVIIGTSHYSPQRFTLTRKDFKTPLGIARTDQAYINLLVGHYGEGLFDDPLAHLPEHSIELEVVFLQYLYEGRRPIRIVPLVVGSFQDCIQDQAQPRSRADIGRMIEALRQTETETDEPICYIISGDLAHVGPKFGDPDPVSKPFLTSSRERDHAILKQAEAADPKGYFRIIAAEGDRRRICGLPPTYTVLEAVGPSQGKVLHYDQYIHPQGNESVSFASVAFYR